jgi:hypothetical protein
MTLTGDLDEVISLCKQTVDLVTSGVLTQTGAMAQMKIWRAFFEISTTERNFISRGGRVVLNIRSFV